MRAVAGKRSSNPIATTATSSYPLNPPRWTPRTRQAVSNPGSAVPQPAYTLDEWKDRFDHTVQPMKETVDIYKKVHGLAYQVLSNLEDQDWDAFTVNHPTRGMQTLMDVANIISIHGGFHLELVERNEASWRENK